MSSEPSFDTLPLHDEPGAHALVPRFWLLIVGGPDAGATFTSSSERMVIGTYDTCDLVLHDSTVSRFHCEIAVAEGQLVLADLGSLNGTTVNGVGVLVAPLASGVTIGVGKTQIRFDVGTDPVKVPLSERRRFGDLAGDEPELRRVFALLERAAATEQPVLLQGGTRALAEALHEESGRRHGPFIAVDCGAVVGTLLEDLLFGRDERPGVFELGAGGTVFLDGLADLPLELQPRLLRVIARREVRRAGAPAATRIDIRIIGGTPRNLRADVNGKRFRSDLFHVVAMHEIRLPTPAAPPVTSFDAARAAHVAAAGKRWAESLLAEHGGDLEAAAGAGGTDRIELGRLLAGKGNHE